MKTIKGKYDGKRVRLAECVPVSHPVNVIVTLLEPARKLKDHRSFLLAGPTLTGRELRTIERHADR